MGYADDGREAQICNRSLTSGLEHNHPPEVKLLIFMTPDLGKFLFPRLPRDQRRREMQILLAALLVGLAIAGAMAMVMIMLAKAKLR